MITNQLINPKGDNTMALKAFTDTPVTYEQFLGWVTAHKEADEYRQGVYWEGGKGCAVGCVLHDAYRNPVVAESLAVMDENIDYLEYSEHRLFEPLFGIPRILARLQDRIFEGLPTEDAKLFPLQFAQALRPGIDYSNVWYKFAEWLLLDTEYGVIRHAKTDRTRAAINGVGALYQRHNSGDIPSNEDWREARNDAAAAAAADAAYADAAAYAYARHKHYQAQRDKLLAIIVEYGVQVAA
jgi:hypothetical protein